MTVLHHRYDPGPDLAGASVDAFLEHLGGPTCLHFRGDDPSRSRMVVTLLHGNEPSGAMAVRRWVASGLTPAVDTRIVVAAVGTALTAPRFSHRMLPGVRDLNRCFRPPFDDAPGQLAQAILQLIDDTTPEAVIDIHNTSGSGPAFGVCRHRDCQHEALASLFTSRLVVASIDLGALMETSDARTPTVTIEVGGREDAPSHELAWEGLHAFLTRPQVLAGEQRDWGMEILADAIRLEIRPGTRVVYDTQPRADADLTLKPDIERFNFGAVTPDIELGWLQGDPERWFRAVDGQGRCAVSRLVAVRDGRLHPAASMRLFMVTTNPRIALSDCLFYAIQQA